jgi:UDP-4-amino-4,6-dideoxy-N-acetyl-beta-L-altrosamine N-acetyltransferase
MAPFMTRADLMIGAGGVTLLERCAAGLPSVSLVVADNQERGTRAAACAGATISLGPAAAVTSRVLADEVERLLGDARAVNSMTLAARALIGSEPGSGASTVAGLMECITSPGRCSTLRPLRAADSARLRAWRNSDRVRLSMNNHHVVSEAEHSEWFARAVAGTERRRFVYECGGVPLGFVTYRDIDQAAGTCEWGFYVGEEWAPRGSGGRLGILALDKAFDEFALELVRAEVLADNAASLAFHARMGFRETGQTTGPSPDGATMFAWRLFELEAQTWRAVRPALAETYFGKEGVS